MKTIPPRGLQNLKGAAAMRKKKLYKILEERLKNNYIVIELFKRRKVFSFGLSTSIGCDGMGHPEHGSYPSYFHAKNAALHCAKNRHQSPYEQTILRKFRLMRDLDQPLLFED
jgi:hypothetical protein